MRYDLLLIWIHILSMGAAFGAWIALAGSHKTKASAAAKQINIALAALLLSGLGLFIYRLNHYQLLGTGIPAGFWHLTGTKLLLLLGLGACGGITAGKLKKEQSPRTVSIIAIVLIVLASLMGVWLRKY